MLNDIVPLPGTVGFGTVLRSIHTEFLDHWSANREEARRELDRLKAEIISTTQVGRPHATLLTAGRTAGGITDIPAVAELMRRLVAEAEVVLARASSLVAGHRRACTPQELARRRRVWPGSRFEVRPMSALPPITTKPAIRQGGR